MGVRKQDGQTRVFQGGGGRADLRNGEEEGFLEGLGRDGWVLGKSQAQSSLKNQGRQWADTICPGRGEEELLSKSRSTRSARGG